MDNRRGNVLIVEDERGSRDSLKMILRPFNNVHTAENSLQAIDSLGDREFDVVTLDLKLPGIQGVELLREIKKIRPNAEIVIITGYGSLKSAIDAIRLGAADYLLKPFNVVELLDTINKVLNKKRRLDNLRNFLSNFSGLENPDMRQTVDYIHFVRVLANTLESKDRFTYHHSVRVHVYCNLIADRLGVPMEERRFMEMGAFLHDIGKIGVDNKIMLKEEKLTPQEIEVVKKHSEIGAELVAPLQLPAQVVSMIRHHHEWYDGNGYPDGLKGDQIPLLTRIISLSESLDAMIADRPYRKSMPLDDIVTELRRCSGGQWDPVLVNVLLDIIAEKGEEILPSAIDPDGKMAAASN